MFSTYDAWKTRNRDDERADEQIEIDEAADYDERWGWDPVTGWLGFEDF